jgi:hypothetical protein
MTAAELDAMISCTYLGTGAEMARYMKHISLAFSNGPQMVNSLYWKVFGV